ncbi:helix-turn-helix domain-containing protein [Streptomyces sp. Sge12]|uniref:helix-turn-helix domain-containing protein n=1 Tax=unclassified Streptomyces TaxID=2593676 RepID=UPI001F019B27|nr:helix-turn-helix domain-containing protein [Streptomyces sp. Sge12]
MARSGAEGRGVLEGAFALMEVLAQGEEVGLTRLATDAELPKATAHRLLGQLVALGAVQSRAGRYRLGARTFRLGQAWHPARALRVASARPLRELASASGRVSLSLSVAEAGQTIVVGGLRGEVDDVFPLSSGVVLPPGSAAELILAGSAPVGEPPEGRSAASWAREVAQARERGLAFEYGQCVSSLSCVSAPILSASGQVVAAVAATALEARQIAPLGESVARAAAMISANLARRPAAGARPHRERPDRPPGTRAPHPVPA